MTAQEKQARIIELKRQKQAIEEELVQLNPFSQLKSMSNKAFGESWSEEYICTRCPSFIRKDEKGWDLWSDALGRVEVKSTRLPCKKITFNQCHPYDCDYFLFVEYDTEIGNAQMFLVPANKFFLFSPSVQHSREDKDNASCFTLNGSSKSNQEKLQAYCIETWEELEKRAKGE